MSKVLNLKRAKKLQALRESRACTPQTHARHEEADPKLGTEPKSNTFDSKTPDPCEKGLPWGAVGISTLATSTAWIVFAILGNTSAPAWVAVMTVTLCAVFPAGVVLLRKSTTESIKVDVVNSLTGAGVLALVGTILALTLVLLPADSSGKFEAESGSPARVSDEALNDHRAAVYRSAHPVAVVGDTLYVQNFFAINVFDIKPTVDMHSRHLLCSTITVKNLSQTSRTFPTSQLVYLDTHRGTKVSPYKDASVVWKLGSPKLSPQQVATGLVCWRSFSADVAGGYIQFDYLHPQLVDAKYIWSTQV